MPAGNKRFCEIGGEKWQPELRCVL